MGFCLTNILLNTNIRPKTELFGRRGLSHGSGGLPQDDPTFHQGQELQKVQAAAFALDERRALGKENRNSLIFSKAGKGERGEKKGEEASQEKKIPPLVAQGGHHTCSGHCKLESQSRINNGASNRKILREYKKTQP
uniref:Uncharacterized protein n=1 Tax=Falco tinnunculus TaxID=100819 RepID=A0A8C4U1E0_FALTI